MKDVMRIEIVSKTQPIVKREIDIHEWYDGDIEEIDSDDYRQQNQIISIKGTEFDENGEVYQAWANYYDDQGRIIKSDRFDKNLNLVDSEEIGYD